MDKEIQSLKQRAEAARILYNQNKITRAEANVEILPYINAFNEKSKIIAKKYGVKPGQLNLSSYLR